MKEKLKIASPILFASCLKVSLHTESDAVVVVFEIQSKRHSRNNKPTVAIRDAIRNCLYNFREHVRLSNRSCPQDNLELYYVLYYNGIIAKRSIDKFHNYRNSYQTSRQAIRRVDKLALLFFVIGYSIRMTVLCKHGHFRNRKCPAYETIYYYPDNTISMLHSDLCAIQVWEAA